MKYAFMSKYKHDLPIRMKCRVLGVAPSGYYEWCKQKPSQRIEQNNIVAAKVKQVFDQHKGRLGARRIAKILATSGEKVGKNRVTRIMKIEGLVAKATRKWRSKTKSNHSLPAAQNLLGRNFFATKPDEKYVTDITYIGTDEGWIYLAAVMDLYSRKLIGWALADSMPTQLVSDALKMALASRNYPKGVIVHSDRGAQYCSAEYQKLLEYYDLRCSMSQAGNCYDNAAMESWNGSFKIEAIKGERFTTKEAAKKHIFEYIEMYYNRHRPHSLLGYLSPNAFEAQYVS